jgi:hypothetical protein
MIEILWEGFHYNNSLGCSGNFRGGGPESGLESCETHVLGGGCRGSACDSGDQVGCFNWCEALCLPSCRVDDCVCLHFAWSVGLHHVSHGGCHGSACDCSNQVGSCFNQWEVLCLSLCYVDHCVCLRFAWSVGLHHVLHVGCHGSTCDGGSWVGCFREALCLLSSHGEALCLLLCHVEHCVCFWFAWSVGLYHVAILASLVHKSLYSWRWW